MARNGNAEMFTFTFGDEKCDRVRVYAVRTILLSESILLASARDKVFNSRGGNGQKHPNDLLVLHVAHTHTHSRATYQPTLTWTLGTHCECDARTGNITRSPMEHTTQTTSNSLSQSLASVYNKAYS